MFVPVLYSSSYLKHVLIKIVKYVCLHFYPLLKEIPGFLIIVK